MKEGGFMQRTKLLTLAACTALFASSSTAQEVRSLNTQFRCPSDEMRVVSTTNAGTTTIELNRDATLTLTSFVTYYASGNASYFNHSLLIDGEECASGASRGPNGRDYTGLLSCTRNYSAGTVMRISVDTSRNERADPRNHSIFVSCAFRS